MGLIDDVLCNNDLFGDHKGETHCTQSLHSVFPGSAYEITLAGRLAGMMTPVFTGQRSDVALHGWIEFRGFGRAKFNDGTMVAFVLASEKSDLEETTSTPSARLPDLDAPIYMQSEALGTLKVNRRTAEAICLRCRHFITDDQGAPNVLERFWAHQVFE